MARHLTVSHNIFLTEEQRYNLMGGETINTVGASVPVWCNGTETDEPAEEVFCQYYLQTDEINQVTINPDGYTVYVRQGKTCQRLRNIDNGGGEFVMFVYKGEVTINEQSFRATHFVSINDFKVLEKSLA